MPSNDDHSEFSPRDLDATEHADVIAAVMQGLEEAERGEWLHVDDADKVIRRALGFPPLSG